jgi:hypothetical protein
LAIWAISTDWARLAKPEKSRQKQHELRGAYAKVFYKAIDKTPIRQGVGRGYWFRISQS